MGAFATETIQGLAELVLFGATGRRRDGFMAAVASYQSAEAVACSAICRSRRLLLEVLTGLGGLAVAAVGASLVTAWHDRAATMLPLLVLISMSAFLPVSESPRWDGSLRTRSPRPAG